MTRAYPLMSIVADFTAGPPNLPGLNQVSLLPTVAGKGTNVRGWSVSRGRQYELDVVQAGMASLDMVDSPEWLNPVNATSPFNIGSNQLLPYRCVQIGAWWNPATQNLAGNLLNATNSANIGGTFNPYYCSFESGIGFVGTLSGSPSLTQSTAQAFDQTHSLAIGFTGASDLPGFGFLTVPGQTYTMSAYVYVPAGVTVTAKFSNFPGALGTTIASATSTVTGAWQRLVMTGVPSGCVGVCSFQQASGSFPSTVYVDAIQLELSSTASPFTITGPTFYPLYTGYIERYPQRWDMSGFRGLKPLECVDALSPLSRTEITQSYAATIAADSPNLVIPYNDKSSPQTVQLPQGGQPFIGYTSLGTNGQVNFSGDTFLDGSEAVSLLQQNLNGAVNSGSLITYQGTLQGQITMNPQAFTIECWVKLNAGMPYFGAASLKNGENLNTEPYGPSFGIGWETFLSGQLGWFYSDPNGTGASGYLPGWGGFADGKWHYLVVRLIGSSQLNAIVDNVIGGVVTLSPSQSVQLNNFYLEAQTYWTNPTTDYAISNLACYPTLLSTTQVGNHYQRGIGYLGEKSGTRALRLLTQYWSSNVVTDAGKTMMAQDYSYNGRYMLDVLQEIAQTEHGSCWADTAGFVHQDSRETRYTATQSVTSQFTFGENTAAGELPYLTAPEMDYDPTYVYSQANIVSAGTGTTLPPIVNTASQTAYGQRILSLTLQTANDWDAQQAGQFYVQRYAKPAGAPGTNVPPRITKLTIDPSSNPALWTAALSLDYGDRITVKRRTSAGVTISGDYYIEKIDHHANAEASTWTVDYELSPVFVSQAWVLGDSVKGVLGSTTTCVY
ncbi:MULTISPECIES: LamG-like jellyroll fold domain-containing protein [Amycolatopsis]|uniref:LamG-like jellyroll fold domain-containing protein n=1 Tax=Amycolatopsis albidoflavus TaxID=102226 RepID=A0ABW5I4I1_9PSEU